MAFRPSVMPQGYNPFAAFLGGAQSGIDLSQKRRAEEQRMNILARQLALQEEQATRQEQAHEAQMEEAGYRRPGYEPSTTQSIVVPSVNAGVPGFMPALVPALNEGETVVQSGPMTGRAYDPNIAARRTAKAADIAAEGMMESVEDLERAGIIAPGTSRFTARYPQFAGMQLQTGARLESARMSANARLRVAEVAAQGAERRAQTAEDREYVAGLRAQIDGAKALMASIENEPTYNFAARERQYNEANNTLWAAINALDQYVRSGSVSHEVREPTKADMMNAHPEWFDATGALKPEATDSAKVWLRDARRGAVR